MEGNSFQSIPLQSPPTLPCYFPMAAITNEHNPSNLQQQKNVFILASWSRPSEPGGGDHTSSNNGWHCRQDSRAPILSTWIKHHTRSPSRPTASGSGSPAGTLAPGIRKLQNQPSRSPRPQPCTGPVQTRLLVTHTVAPVSLGVSAASSCPGCGPTFRAKGNDQLWPCWWGLC